MMAKPLGLYLYQKASAESKVLKEMLQLLRTAGEGQTRSFSYIEAETSLHPELSLAQGLCLEGGFSSWEDCLRALNSEQKALISVLCDPEMKAKEAAPWETFIISLLKGVLGHSQHLLIDMNENVLTPFLSKTVKEVIISATKGKTVFMASANPGLWLDCTHSLVTRKNWCFEIQELDTEVLKKYWTA